MQCGHVPLRAGSIKIRAGLKKADEIGTPEAVNNASHQDLWRTGRQWRTSRVEGCTSEKRRSPELCFTVAVM